MSNPKMTRSECEGFLADVHVGVLSVSEEGRGPCTVPVWYSYSPGGSVRITAGRDSRKVRLLRLAKRASLCVQVEQPPCQYVSVEGMVEVVETDVADDQRAIAYRYLGEKRGQRYLESADFDLSQEVLLLLHPERWWSVDFRKL